MYFLWVRGNNVSFLLKDPYQCWCSTFLPEWDIWGDFLKKTIFREKGREGDREGEKHQHEREASISCLLGGPAT